MVPGALALANSAADLTSTRVAPFFFSSGSMARTLLEFHHLYENQRTSAMKGQYFSKKTGKSIYISLLN
jgi:hypothetical protein